MIVFDLKCDHGHVFEAWFANSEAFDDQKAHGLLACPICGIAQVDKAVMAPNVAPKGNQRRAAADLPAMAESPTAPAEVKEVLSKLAKLQAALLEKSEYVGNEFATKARAMDAGEIDPAIIHGQTTPEEAKALLEEGIAVTPLLFPIVPPEKQN
jgi:hypothetical protein